MQSKTSLVEVAKKNHFSECPACQAPLFYDRLSDTIFCDNCDFKFEHPRRVRTANDEGAECPEDCEIILHADA